MLRAKLIKVESTHSNIRTDEILGKITHIPEEGNSFTIFSDALVTVPGLPGIRVVRTSPIQTVDFDDATNTFTFKTMNSTYKLEMEKGLTVEEIFSYRSWGGNA